VTDPDFEKLQAIRSNPGPPGLADLRPDLYRALPAVTVERVTQDSIVRRRRDAQQAALATTCPRRSRRHRNRGGYASHPEEEEK
jgi:hypothetical protein